MPTTCRGKMTLSTKIAGLLDVCHNTIVSYFLLSNIFYHLICSERKYSSLFFYITDSFLYICRYSKQLYLSANRQPSCQFKYRLYKSHRSLLWTPVLNSRQIPHYQTKIMKLRKGACQFKDPNIVSIILS